MGRNLLGRSRVGGWIAGGALLTAISGQSWALGLGEIELDSALNEDLKAEIELFDTANLSPSEIRVSLASSEDFDRVGVERLFFLTDLNFKVIYGPNGNAEVKITSSRPITEPYLNFLVEVLWPNGRLLKEYTVLLDPPTFSEAGAPQVAAPAETKSSPASAGRVERQQQAQASTGTRVQMAPPPKKAAAPSPLDQGVVGDEFRMTDRDDTLWSIASRTRPSSAVSVHQNMLAIQRLNPDAFIDGNINLMKAGYSLKLPDEAQAQQISQSDALAQVQRQNEAWQAIARGETPPSQATAPAAVASRTTDQTSNLRSPVDATSKAPATSSSQASEGELRIVAGAGDSATGRATEAVEPGALTAALEEKDRLDREVEELNYKLDQQQELVDNQIAVKDRQLEVKDQQIAQLQQQLKDLKELQAQAATQPAAAPAKSQNQNAQKSAKQSWWENPLVLYGAAGALVLALVGGLIAARRRRNDAEEDFFEPTQPTLGETDELEEAFAAADDEFEEDIDDALEADDSGEETPKSETSDIIGEADIYIAYGRYPQAIGLLLSVLDEDPDRNDVRMKLLELFAETNDRDAFDRHMAELVEHCEDEGALSSARELESRFGESAISLDDMLAEGAGGQGGHEHEETVELDISGAEEPPAVTLEPDDLQPTAARLNGGDDVDFELELDELDATDATKRGAGDELGGDLGIDFDPDRDVAGAEDDLPTLEFERDGDAELRNGDQDRIDLDDMGLSSDYDGGTQPSGGTGLQTASNLDDDLALADDDEFDFEDEGDSANTKLDLARAYIDMGDADGAKDILKEVLAEGNSEQQQQAQSMLESL